MTVNPIKYKIRSDLFDVSRLGLTAYRIQALRSFGDVHKDDLGGYIYSENNLSHEGDCWVYNNACVFQEAHVYGDAKVRGQALVLDHAQVFGNAIVASLAQVYGKAQVFGNAYVGGDIWVLGDCCVYGYAKLTEGPSRSHGWYYGPNPFADYFPRPEINDKEQ